MKRINENAISTRFMISLLCLLYMIILVFVNSKVNAQQYGSCNEPGKNIILALCFTMAFGPDETRFSVKPSAYLMPEIVFTNHANYEMVKKTKVIKINPPAINIFQGKDKYGIRKSFQLRIPLPDLACVFINAAEINSKIEFVQKDWYADSQFPDLNTTTMYMDDLFVYVINR